MSKINHYWTTVMVEERLLRDFGSVLFREQCHTAGLRIETIPLLMTSHGESQ